MNSIDKVKSKYIYCYKAKKIDDDPDWPIYHVCCKKINHEDKHKCAHCKEEWEDER